MSSLFTELAAATWQILLELAPWLLFGTLIAGVLHVALPKHLVRGSLRGPWGVVKAVLVGVPMPLCSCGVIPAGLGLRRDGASRGAALGFLISTPQTGVDSILVSASFLGWPFALFKVAAAGVMGVFGGLLADRVGGDGDEAPGDETSLAMAKAWPRALIDHGLDLLRSIWGWLVVGVVVSALIDVVVPDTWLQGLGALGPLGAGLAALAVSLPLYVCATASVPIAAALVAGGMPAGAALVFLMAGPATNVATLGAVYRGFGARILAVYLSVLVFGSLGAAWLFESVIPPQAVLRQGHEHGAAWWATASALALLALLTAFAALDLRLLLRRWLARSNGSAAHTSHLLVVQGMTCDGCARRVQSALYAVHGVRGVEVDRPAGVVTVRASASGQSPGLSGAASSPSTGTPSTGTPSIGELCAALEAAGYPSTSSP